MLLKTGWDPFGIRIIAVVLMPISGLDHQYYARLAGRIRRGDEEAFTELYTQTYKSIYRYAYYFLKNADLVPDALQEIYIAVYRNISSLKIDRLLYPWMKQIAYHICCDMAKRERRQAQMMVGFEDGETIDRLTMDNDRPDPFQEVYDRDTRAQLDKALAALPAKERMAFQLRYLQNLKMEEVADFMGVSLASAKRYVQNARAALQKSLGHLRQTV